ncbi:response regulator transcription factor [Psychrosphaera sp. B3R10]|uniref:response regulator n=1 Tax=unclassified Psychrosphaera TaxID=2641570 RepID=UPI001C07FDEF|nr:MULTISPECIES: response regulator transcription factor [unclassified Psychrosphaera]MBU2880641.1 response regulator transcription factor [Psychrosphaera sp. I2R16]MBU2990727.1 response regulator transcription factor [Psychrosphaera sp. B3R10]
MQPEKIIVADDHPLFRQALLETLRSKLTHTQWLEAENVNELNTLLAENTDADLLLLDLNIPGAHGFNTLIHVRRHFPQIPVVVVSAYDDVDTISSAMEHGSSGFVPKSTPVETIFLAINEVFSGNIWTPPNFSAQTAQSGKSDIAERIASLTPQQYKILMMFAEGLLNKQIAYDLHVSEATIKAHATAIFKKLNVRNRTQAVITLNELDLSGTAFETELSTSK